MSPLNYTVATATNTKQYQRGFTLLELVLVLFIIALIASTPLLFIDEQDQQLRYEETLQKMSLLKDGIYKHQSLRGQPVLSGFVVNNGVLPSNTDFSDLVTSPAGWLSSSQAVPYFNFTADASKAVALSGLVISKGHITTVPLSILDSSRELKDAWGNDFATNITADSYEFGLSNTSPAFEYANDSSLAHNVASNDWQIPLSSIDLLLVNTSEATVPAPSDASQAVALLVFKNTNSTNAGRWTTYHADMSLNGVSQAIPGYNQKAASDLVWKKSGSTVTPSDEMLPIGIHPLIIIKDNGVNTGEYEADDEIRISRFVTVIPNSTQPTLTLTVSP